MPHRKFSKDEKHKVVKEHLEEHESLKGIIEEVRNRDKHDLKMDA